MRYNFCLMKSNWILLILLLFLGACKDQPGSTAASGNLESVEAKDAYGYLEKFTRDRETFAREGGYQRLDSLGRLLEEANFRRDTLDGLRILYYESGDTQVVEHYEMGNFVGAYRAFYPNGQLEIEGNYEFNSMEGPWRRYYESGALMEIVTFADNEENGAFYEYYENGNSKAEGTYLNGDNEHGLLKLFDEEGELIKTMNCEKGICRTVWKKDN